MSKRGQFTLFVILGIVLILIVGTVYYFRADLFPAEELVYPSEVQEVVDWTDECLLTVSRNAIDYVSLRAGNYRTETDFAVDFGDMRIPYGYYAGQNILITTSDMALNVEAYVNDIAPISCHVLNPYREEFNLSLEDFKVDVNIQNESIDVLITTPVLAQLPQTVYTLPEEYVYRIDARVGYVHDAASNIIDLFVANPDEFELNSILAQGVTTEIVDLNGEDYLIRIRDAGSYEGDAEYIFVFTAYFPPSEEELTEEEYIALVTEETL